MYTATGEFKCTQESFSQPGWVDPQSKQAAWQERSAGGYPMPNTEWGKEKHAPFNSAGTDAVSLTGAWASVEGFAKKQK